MSDLLETLKSLSVSAAATESNSVELPIKLFEEIVSEVDRMRTEIRQCALKLISAQGQSFDNYELYLEAKKRIELAEKLGEASRKILEIFDSPTKSVTQWDSDELKAALERFEK